MIDINQIKIWAEMQQQLEILNQNVKSVDPEKLSELNNLIHEFALKELKSREVMESQKKVIAQQNEEIEALRTQNQALQVLNPGLKKENDELRALPVQVQPLKILDPALKMEDEEKAGELDAAVPVRAMLSDQEEVAKLLTEKNHVQALEQHPVKGPNMDNMLDFLENRLEKFSRRLRGTFYYVTNHGNIYATKNGKFDRGIKEDAKSIGQILALFIMQKENMDRLQYERAYSIITDFKNFTSEEGLENAAGDSEVETDDEECTGVDEALEMVDVIFKEGFRLLIESFKPSRDVNPEPDA